MRRATTILHADMDAFYAAVEQRDHPELRGQPVIVCGRSQRAVVLTASYEARVFGVHSAMPALHARHLCPDGRFVPPRMEHYTAAAKQIRAVFAEFTPLVEPLSLDEAFLDITGSLRLFGGAVPLAHRLRQRIRDTADLPVSVGIGPTKMIAKIASAMAKPDGVLHVPDDHVGGFLKSLPVNQLWGVGPSTHATLSRLGLTTVGALADADPAMLERRLGHLGRALWELACGRDPRPVDPMRQRKSYGEEQTFERDLRDGSELRRTIAAQAETVARRLRTDACSGRTVTLKVKLARQIAPGKYPVLTRRVTLPAAIDDGPAIAAAALGLWNTVSRGTVVRLIGVAVSGIDSVQSAQLPLFAGASVPRRAALNAALDHLAQRFGNDVVVRGSLAGAPRGKVR